MQSVRQNIVKAIVAAFIGASMLIFITRTTMPKFFTNWNCPLATNEGFYALKDNTVDVLTLGSSYSFCSMDPQYLYDRKNIRSFDFGSGNQSIMLSYFFLKEALRSQSPKAVIVEADLCWKRIDTPYNMSEADVRRAIDYMPLSPVKLEACRAYSEMDDAMTLSSFLFPIIRYHERWKELNEDDYMWSEKSGKAELKGFYAQATCNERKGYKPYSRADSKKTVEMDPVSLEYLEKINELCKDNNMHLILYRSPALYGDPINESPALEKWASDNNVPFYDFNEITLYQDIQFNFDEDAGDYRHCNIYGARKVTDYMGKVLSDLGVPSIKDEQWENSRERYQQEIKDITLYQITDPDQFIKEIADEDYTVFVSSKGAVSEKYLPVLKELADSLGINSSQITSTSNSFGAAVENGKMLFFDSRSGVIEKEGTFRNEKGRYRLKCYNGKNVGKSEITIDDYNWSKNRDGLNIVVYSNSKRKALDSVCIGPSEAGMVVTR